MKDMRINQFVANNVYKISIQMIFEQGDHPFFLKGQGKNKKEAMDNALDNGNRFADALQAAIKKLDE